MEPYGALISPRNSTIPSPIQKKLRPDPEICLVGAGIGLWAIPSEVAGWTTRQLRSAESTCLSSCNGLSVRSRAHLRIEQRVVPYRLVPASPSERM